MNCGLFFEETYMSYHTNEVPNDILELCKTYK